MSLPALQPLVWLFAAMRLYAGNMKRMPALQPWVASIIAPNLLHHSHQFACISTIIWITSISFTPQPFVCLLKNINLPALQPLSCLSFSHEFACFTAISLPAQRSSVRHDRSHQIVCNAPNKLPAWHALQPLVWCTLRTVFRTLQPLVCEHCNNDYAWAKSFVCTLSSLQFAYLLARSASASLTALQPLLCMHFNDRLACAASSREPALHS